MSLINEIKIKSLSDAQEILKAAGSEDIFEKAHKDGDLHPNGKWVWVSSAAGGKGDWRTLNGRTHKKHQVANAAGGNGGGSKESGGNTGASSKKDNRTEYEKFSDHYLLNSFKHASDNALQQIIDSPTTNDKERKIAKKILDDRKKNKSSKSNKTSKTETYSHNINGVTVNVSKNKDGSYTLEANGKKVKSDDPSFFKDKLTPRVKKALAKEVGIDISTTSKKSFNSLLKNPSKVFRRISAKNSDEFYKKTLSYIGGRISTNTLKGHIEGVIQNAKKKDDKVELTIKKDDGGFVLLTTSMIGRSKYQVPQPNASKIKEIKDSKGKKEVKISSAMGVTDWNTVNYLINSGIEIQYQHGLSFRGGSNSSKKISAEEALEKIHKNTTFDAHVDDGVLHIHTYSGFDMD